MHKTGIYYIDGKMVEESGNVSVYEMNNELFLEIGPGHTLWTLESELKDYIKQLNSLPFGNVLEIGLGLGIASRYLLSCEKVESLTTIEINRDVVQTYNKLKNFVDERYSDFITYAFNKEHRIISCNGLSYITHTTRKYDFIFIDCYTILDEETLPEIEKLVIEGKKILNKNGIIMGWFDKFTPDPYVGFFNDIFDCKYKAEDF